MKNKLSKWWFLIVIAIPFLLMLCLHIGIALGNYFDLNINVPNVDASTWFIFCSSYLCGTMTLVGVMVTLRHERSIHQYEKSLESIDKERESLGKAICVEIENYKSKIIDIQPQREKLLAAMEEISK